jgi:hypothetical protein
MYEHDTVPSPYTCHNRLQVFVALFFRVKANILVHYYLHIPSGEMAG